MANELAHGSVGTTMTQAEFEAVGLHVLNSQATGDLIYASSSSQLSRLAIGAADTVLTCNGTVPSWSATPILNTAVAKGTWTASGTWTIPAVTLGGTVTINGRVFNAGSGSAEITTTGQIEGLKITTTNDTSLGGRITFTHISTSPAANDYIYSLLATGKDLDSPQNTVQYGTMEFLIEDATSEAAEGKYRIRLAQVSVLTEVLTLSSAGVLDILNSVRVNSTQVVGARVIDARCDDAINSGDATTDGVIDALRDAMISHGLVAAA